MLILFARLGCVWCAWRQIHHFWEEEDTYGSHEELVLSVLHVHPTFTYLCVQSIPTFALMYQSSFDAIPSCSSIMHTHAHTHTHTHHTHTHTHTHTTHVAHSPSRTYSRRSPITCHCNHANDPSYPATGYPQGHQCK